jgi:hypothetical protein
MKRLRKVINSLREMTTWTDFAGTVLKGFITGLSFCRTAPFFSAYKIEMTFNSQVSSSSFSLI